MTLCYGCRTPGATVRGVDGEPYHRDCRKQYGKEPAIVRTP